MTGFCIACLKKGHTENHHIKTRGAGGLNDSDNLLELCRACHIKWHAIGAIKFIKFFPHLEHILHLQGWKTKQIFGITKLIRG